MLLAILYGDRVTTIVDNELLRLDEVAAICRTSIHTVRYWIAMKRLPSIRPGRRRLVRRADLERFLDGVKASEP